MGVACALGREEFPEPEEDLGLPVTTPETIYLFSETINNARHGRVDWPIILVLAVFVFYVLFIFCTIFFFCYLASFKIRDFIFCLFHGCYTSFTLHFL